VRATAVAAIVLLTVASLGLLGWQRLAAPSQAAGTTATMDGITTQVQWIRDAFGE
jgi:hypothetical protein